MSTGSMGTVLLQRRSPDRLAGVGNALCDLLPVREN
jgi:hypothetical protein